MATKISAMTTGTPEAGDFLVFVDTSDTTEAATGTTKKANASFFLTHAATPESLNPDFMWQAVAGVTTAGGAVSAWVDTVAGVSAVNATGAEQPTHDISDANWNVLPSVTGDFARSLAVDVAGLPLSQQRFFHDGTTDWEIQMLFRPLTTEFGRGLLGTKSSSNNANGFTLKYTPDGGAGESGTEIFVGNGATTFYCTTAEGVIVAGTKYVIGAKFIAATKYLSLTINGVASGPGVTMSALAAGDAPYTLNLLSEGNEGNELDGSVPEILIFKRVLLSAERANLVAYWQDKYDF